MRLFSLELSNDEIVVNGQITATVRLEAAAPAGGVPVLLGASDPALKVPKRVVVPAGQIQYSFIIMAGTLLPLIGYQVWAQVEETVFRRKVTLKPTSLFGLAFSPSIIDGGNPVTLTVTLDSPAPSTGTLVLLKEVLNYAGEPTPLLTDLPLSVYFASGEVVKTVNVNTRDWDGGREPPPRQVDTAVDAVLDSSTKRAILTITDP